MFKNLFSFEGRIGRAEYFISFFLYWVSITLTAVLMEQNVWLGLLYIPALWFLWSQGAKRCHDRGISGWYQLIPFYFIFLLLSKGYPGLNEYDKGSKVKEAAMPNVLDTEE